LSIGILGKKRIIMNTHEKQELNQKLKFLYEKRSQSRLATSDPRHDLSNTTFEQAILMFQEEQPLGANTAYYKLIVGVKQSEAAKQVFESVIYRHLKLAVYGADLDIEPSDWCIIIESPKGELDNESYLII